jgi:MFS family permease
VRIFRGWVVVAGAFSVMLVAYGIQYSFGVFFAALLEEFGWSRASLSGAFSLYAAAYCIVGFPAGRLTDVWGPRPVITLGGVFLGAAFVGMAFVTRLWHPYVLYGVVAAIGMGTAYVPCSATVVRWFVRRRGLATGLASTGASLGSLVFPPIAQLLITAVGWRGAYLVFGIAAVLAIALAATVMRRDPEGVGLHPDGDDRPPPTEVAGDAWPLRRALRTSAFWLLWATFSAAWLPIFIPLVHIPRFTRDLGFSPLVAATVVSALGAGAIVGRLSMGALSDRVGRKRVAGLAMAGQALTFVAFMLVAGLIALYATTFAFGFTYGAVSAMFAPIVGDFFGRARAGSLVGVLFATAGSIAGAGPVAAGALFDLTGSYDAAFALSAALSAIAVILLTLCRPPLLAPAAKPAL